MSDQETKYNLYQIEEEAEAEAEVCGFDLGTFTRLAMLSLNAGQDTPEAPPSTAEQCTQCGGSGSTKRRSPSSSSSFQEEPTSKKPNLLKHSSASSSPIRRRLRRLRHHRHPYHHPRRYTQLPLPTTAVSPPPTTDPHGLHRSLSDPITSPGTQIATISPATSVLTSQTDVPAASPSPAKSASAQMPPLPPILRRAASDPSSSTYQPPPQAVVTTTAAPTTLPRHPVARANPRSPCTAETGSESSNRESPNSKRLKRMKDRLKEMRQWWDHVTLEGEEEEVKEEEEAFISEDNNANNNNSKDETEADADVEAETGTTEEEAVWVERTGDFLVIHFQCPCGKGYKILLSGSNCYYKLCGFDC